MTELSRDGKLPGTPDMHFLKACRSFYDAGADNFNPKYAHYGDLLEASKRVVEALQSQCDRYRVALEAREYLSSLYERLWKGGVVRDLAEAIAHAEQTRTALSDTLESLDAAGGER